VLTLAVLPASRRQGLAGALLRTGLAQAKTLGAVRGFLEVGAYNPAALALYRGAGWRGIGRRAKYYRRGADALLLRLDLTGGEQPLHE
jgi:ribosomal-protein-alanine N-acetyltransferase